MFEYARVIQRERTREASNYRLANSVIRNRRSRAGAARASLRHPSSIK